MLLLSYQIQYYFHYRDAVQLFSASFRFIFKMLDYDNQRKD